MKDEMPMPRRPTSVRKLPAESVRYGRDISRRGGYVYGAFDGERLVSVAATADGARQAYRRAWAAWINKREG